MKDNICLLDHHQRSLWNTISIGLKEMINRVLQLNISQSENSFNSHLEKHFKLVLPSQPNSLNPLKIERGNLWPKRLLLSRKKSSVLPIDRGNLWKEARTKCKKLVLSNIVMTRTSSTFAIDDENIDFNIPGVPNAMVKRSHGINVHNLIQQIENHLQREALQSDLQQHRAFNPFSKESKDAIMAAGNTELCEIIDVEPKSQCRACVTHWSTGIVYCTCVHFMKDDTTENKKYISSVLDLFSIPNFYIRKGWPHGHRYGKAPVCKEYHTANQLQKRCRKKKYDNIHDRFIRDKFFRKTMIELGRSEEIILEMDRLASENHSHIATKAEIDLYRGNWWIRSNVVNFDTMPTRHQPDFKKALSTLYRLKKAEDKKHYEKWSQSSSSWWQWQTNWWEPDYENSPQRWSDHWLNGETCVFGGQLFICGMNLSNNWMQNLSWIYRLQLTAVYCHRRGV